VVKSTSLVFSTTVRYARGIAEKRPLLHTPSGKESKVAVIKAGKALGLIFLEPFYHIIKTAFQIALLAVSALGAIWSKNARSEVKKLAIAFADDMVCIPFSPIKNLLLVFKSAVGICSPKSVFRKATEKEIKIINDYKESLQKMEIYYSKIDNPKLAPLIRRNDLDALREEDSEAAYLVNFAHHVFPKIAESYRNVMTY
jgi:hypothetical protein